MTCPHCQHIQKLTMRAYYRAPRGRHTCESCGQRFGLRFSLSYLALLFLACIATVAAPSVILYWLTHSFWVAALCGLVCCFVFYFPIDRLLDERKNTKKL